MSNPCDSTRQKCVGTPVGRFGNFSSFPLAPQPSKQESVDQFVGKMGQALDQIKRGSQHIKAFRLPWGNRPLFGTPLPKLDEHFKPNIHYEFINVFGYPLIGYPVLKYPKKSVYLHIDQNNSFETLNPIEWRHGKIDSGEIKIYGKVGITFLETFNRDPIPLLLNLDTVRFEEGRIFASFQTFKDQGKWISRLPLDGVRIILDYVLGEPNDNGEYDVTERLEDFFKKYFKDEQAPKQGYLKGLQTSQLIDLAHRARKQEPEVIHENYPHWPDWFQDLRMYGEVDFGAPLYEADGKRLMVSGLEDVLDASRNPLAHVVFHNVSYENLSKNTKIKMGDVEVLLYPGSSLKTAEPYRGLGEIIVGPVKYSGSSNQNLIIGFKGEKQRIFFHYENDETGTRFRFETEGISLSKEAGEVLARLNHFLLNGAYNLDERRFTIDGDFNLQAEVKNAVRLNSQVALTAEGNLSCSFASSDPSDLNGMASCVGFSHNSQFRFFDPKGEIALQVGIPNGAQGKIEGSVVKEGDLITGHVSDWQSHFEAFSDRLVGSMTFQIDSMGREKSFGTPHLRGGKVLYNLQSGFTGFEVDHFEGTADLNVVTQGYETSVESHFNLSSIDYVHATRRARVKGGVRLINEMNPNKFLNSAFDKILARDGTEQKFELGLSLKDWELGGQQLFTLNQGEFYIKALNTQPLAEVSIFPPEPPEVEMLDPKIRIPKAKAGEEPFFSIPSMAQVVGGLLGLVFRVEEVDLKVPQDHWDLDVPLLGTVLSFSFEFPKDISWRATTKTRLNSKTGEEEFVQFVVGPEQPVRTCLNLFGQCLTQEEVTFSGVELITKNPPPATFDYTSFEWDEAEGYKSGEVAVYLTNWSGFVNPLKILFGWLGMDPEVYGVKTNGHGWRLPLALSDFEKIAKEAAELKREQAKENEEKESSVKSDLQLNWEEITGIVDLLFKGGHHEIGVSGDKDFHPHLSIDMAPKTRLKVWRKDPKGVAAMEPFQIRKVGVTIEKAHDEATRSIHSQKSSESPFFLYLNDIALGKMGPHKVRPIMDPSTKTIHLPYQIGSAQFQIGRPDGRYRWAGNVSNVQGRNLTYDTQDKLDVYDEKMREYPASTISTDQLEFDFSFTKVCNPLKDAQCKPVEFIASPRITRTAYFRTFPHRVEGFLGSVSDKGMSFRGPHYAINNLGYEAPDGIRVLTSLDGQEVMEGKVIVEVPSLTLFPGAEIELGDDIKLKLVEEGQVIGTVIQSDNDRVHFSSQYVDLPFDKVTLEFLRLLGLENVTMDLNHFRMMGPISKESYVRKGNINLEGRIGIETSGHLDFKYDSPLLNIDHFESEMGLKVEAVRRLQTKGGKLSLLEFEGVTFDIQDLHARLFLIGMFMTHLSHDVGQPLANLDGQFEMGEAIIKIDRESDPKDPNISLSLNGLSFRAKGKSKETSLTIGSGENQKILEFPDVKFELNAKGAVVATKVDGVWKRKFTMGAAEFRAFLKGAKILSGQN